MSDVSTLPFVVVFVSSWLVNGRSIHPCFVAVING
jgi:hypothetical protein